MHELSTEELVIKLSQEGKLIKQICNQAHVSPKYVATVVSKKLNKTQKELKYEALKRDYIALKNQGKTIDEISEELGVSVRTLSKYFGQRRPNNELKDTSKQDS